MQNKTVARWIPFGERTALGSVRPGLGESGKVTLPPGKGLRKELGTKSMSIQRYALGTLGGLALAGVFNPIKRGYR